MSAVVAVTGATGYLGGVIGDYLSAGGDRIIALTRRPADEPEFRWQHFELGSPIDDSAFIGVDTLVHAAWVLSGKDTGQLWRQNVVGSRDLIETAVAAGVSKVVFISSMSSFFGTRQAYGLMKLAVERTVLDAGGVVVRPGLVYGDSPGGMAATLKKVAELPIWPSFKNARMFMAHEDDIAPALLRVLADFDDYRGQVLGFANPASYGLREILTGLSPDGKPRRSVFVPTGAVTATLKLVEAMNVKLPFRSDSLLGLVEGAATLPGQDILSRHSIRFRAFDIGDRAQGLPAR